MKKISLILLIATSLFVAIPANAQIKFGLKAGLNLNKAHISGISDNFKSENTTGFFIGPMADFKIPLVGLGADASLLFSQRSTKLSVEDMEYTAHQNAIEIPLNLKYSFGLGNMASIFFAVGPDFIFNLEDNDIVKDISDLPESSNESTNKADVAINVGVGTKLLNHFQIGVNYNIPVTNNVKSDVTSFTSKNRTWQISLAYLF